MRCGAKVSRSTACAAASRRNGPARHARCCSGLPPPPPPVPARQCRQNRAVHQRQHILQFQESRGSWTADAAPWPARLLTALSVAAFSDPRRFREAAQTEAADPQRVGDVIQSDGFCSVRNELIMGFSRAVITSSQYSSMYSRRLPARSRSQPESRNRRSNGSRLKCLSPGRPCRSTPAAPRREARAAAKPTEAAMHILAI